MVNTITLRGGITGAAWWPAGAVGIVEVNLDLGRERGRLWSPDGSRATLRETLDHVLMEKGGDFSGSVFTADTYLEITTGRGPRRVSRIWELSAFPSVSDLRNADVYTHDFCSDGED